MCRGDDAAGKDARTWGYRPVGDGDAAVDPVVKGRLLAVRDAALKIRRRGLCWGLAVLAVTSCGGGFKRDAKPFRQCPCPEEGMICNTGVLPPYCRPAHASKLGEPCSDHDNCAKGLFCSFEHAPAGSCRK